MKEAEEAHRALFYISKRIGIHHLTVGSLIEDTLIAAGGDHIAAYRHERNDAEQNHKGMGECPLSLFFLLHRKNPLCSIFARKSPG